MVDTIDRRRPVGRVQPVPHGHHGPRTWPSNTAFPCHAGRPWRSASQQSGRGAGCGQASVTKSCPCAHSPEKGLPGWAFERGRVTSTARPMPRPWLACSPGFDKAGTVTAGNASGINDGAAAVVVMAARRAAALGLKPLARITGLRHQRPEPRHHGYGALYPPSRKALQRASWQLGRCGLVRAERSLCCPGLCREQGAGQLILAR